MCFDFEFQLKNLWQNDFQQNNEPIKNQLICHLIILLKCFFELFRLKCPGKSLQSQRTLGLDFDHMNRCKFKFDNLPAESGKS